MNSEADPKKQGDSNRKKRTKKAKCTDSNSKQRKFDQKRSIQFFLTLKPKFSGKGKDKETKMPFKFFTFNDKRSPTKN